MERGCHDGAPERESHDMGPARDPVCGMTVMPASARGGSHVHAGTTYYFCNPRCRERFTAEPQKYLGEASPLSHATHASSASARGPQQHPGEAASHGTHAALPSAGSGAHSKSGLDARADELDPGRTRATGTATAAPIANQSASYVCPMDPEVRSPSPGPCPKCGMALEPEQPVLATRTQYVCPMHPEVVADAPGACPKCGMALEPREVSAADAANPELENMQRRFWLSALLSAPVLVFAMGEHVAGPALSELLSARANGWLQGVLSGVVVLWGGWPFFARAAASVANRSLNMFTLIAGGSAAAFTFSVVALLWPQAFPHAMSHAGAAPLYFEAAAMIVTLALLGQVLELRARQATSGAIRALLAMAPPTARRVRDDGAEQDVPLDAVAVGDRLRVLPSHAVPVDGVVQGGASAVDESMLTGEPMPVAKTAGSQVTGGTMNLSGTFVMRATRVGQHTLLAHIVSLVTQAQRSRASIQRLADRVSGWFVPAVVVVAVLTAIAWGALGPEPRAVHALVNAVAVLVIACPCALGLATPMSIMVGSGRGARSGVLIRNAEALELLQQVDTLLVDKTGTLTVGAPQLQSVIASAGVEESELLQIAAALELGSEHPLAAAILAGARQRTQATVFDPAHGLESHVGRGMTGRLQGVEVALGNERLLQQLGTAYEAFESRAQDMRAQGQTAVFVVRDRRVIGLLGVADRIKQSAPAALRALRASGVEVVMLSGDSERTALAVARELGIEQVYADATPERKAQVVRMLQASGKIVAMAGDGTNDAPALAAAHVGIAMGTGTDVALQSAGITLVKGELDGIVRARHLSQQVLRNIRQNLGFALLYNALGIPIAAGVLYPLLGVLLSPVVASAAMALSSVSVIANALRLRRIRL